MRLHGRGSRRRRSEPVSADDQLPLPVRDLVDEARPSLSTSSGDATWRTSSEHSPGPPRLPLYLGPALPRWQPRTVEDVQRAIDDGTLRERHWLDVKAEVGTTDGTKRDLRKTWSPSPATAAPCSSASARTSQRRRLRWNPCCSTASPRQWTRSLVRGATHRSTSSATPCSIQP
jgi:hypothetical protein